MVGFWILMILGVGAGLGIGISWFIYGNNEGSVGHRVGAIIVGLVLIVGTILGGVFYRSTESGQRMEKTWESETGGGIERTVTVYDIEGDIIKEYTGKFDVDYDECRIIFDDESGLRHIIYYTTGTVIIDENSN